MKELAYLLAVFIGVISDRISRYAERSHEQNIRLEALASHRERGRYNIGNYNGGTGCDSNRHALARAVIYCIQKNYERENKLVVTEVNACAVVAEKAHTVHNRNLEDDIPTLIFESVINDEPEHRRDQNYHEENDHFGNVEKNELVIFCNRKEILKYGDYADDQNKKFKRCIYVFPLRLVFLGFLVHILSPHCVEFVSLCGIIVENIGGRKSASSRGLDAD